MQFLGEANKEKLGEKSKPRPVRPCHEVTVETHRVAHKNCFLLASARRSGYMREADHRQSASTFRHEV